MFSFSSPEQAFAYFPQREQPCIWMLQIQLLCPTVGADMQGLTCTVVNQINDEDSVTIGSLFSLFLTVIKN